MMSAALEKFLRESRSQIDDRLSSIFDNLPRWVHAPQGVDAMRHAVFAGGGGKRLRPALALLSAELNGTPRADVLDAAAGLELIHSYSIVIDDIQDGDEMRRGAAATHVRFGINDGLLAAGRLFAEGLTLIQELPIEAGQIRQIMHFFHAGQEADLASGGWRDSDKTSDALDFILRGKTGTLFELSMLIGGGPSATPRLQKDLREIGSEIGLLFQAQDDILELTSSSDALGKPAGKDRGGKLQFVSRVEDLADAATDILERKIALQRRVESLARGEATLLCEFIELTVHRSS